MQPSVYILYRRFHVPENLYVLRAVINYLKPHSQNVLLNEKDIKIPISDYAEFLIPQIFKKIFTDINPSSPTPPFSPSIRPQIRQPIQKVIPEAVAQLDFRYAPLIAHHHPAAVVADKVAHVYDP